MTTRISSPKELVTLAEEQPHFGDSAWHQITQEQINLFADATGDHQWIHVDPEQAKSGPFGTTIAHGYLTLSLAPVFLTEILQVDGAKMALNYGLNKVRFPAPVPVASRMRAGLQLLAAQERGGGAIEAVLQMTCEIEGSERPACVAELVVLYRLEPLTKWAD